MDNFPRLRMVANFELLERNKDNSFTSISHDNVQHITPGGFGFQIDGKNIQFDFDAFCCKSTDDHYQYESGYGFTFNDFTLAEYYDEDLKEIGLSRKDLTAEYLSSASDILEFFVDADMKNNEEIAVGCNMADAKYAIKIISIDFIDMNGEEEASYPISKDVLERFNSVA